MLKKSQLLLLFTPLALSLIVSACGGSRSMVQGSQCSRGYAPVPMNAPNKMSVQSLKMDDGEYTLARAVLHFHGDPTPRSPEGFQVVVTEDVPRGSKSNVMSARPECFRNSKVDQAHQASVPTLTHILVKDGAITESDVKDFGFTINEAGAFEIEQSASTKKTAPLHRVLDRDALETFVIRWGNDYEVRTKGRGLNGEYTVSMFMRRAG